MAKIRFTVSLEKELLEKFDNNIKFQQYTNRSEAIRDLLREQIVDEEWESGAEVIGSITMVYNHHEREASGALTSIQHEYNDAIISTQHIHIDHVNCLEVVIIRGTVEEITELYHTLKAAQGVKQCELTRSTTGKLLS